MSYRSSATLFYGFKITLGELFDGFKLNIELDIWDELREKLEKHGMEKIDIGNQLSCGNSPDTIVGISVYKYECDEEMGHLEIENECLYKFESNLHSKLMDFKQNVLAIERHIPISWNLSVAYQ